MCEIPVVYEVKTVKARKQHKCCECRGIIEIGESYNIHSGLWAGEWGNYKVCPECDEIRREVDKNCYYEEGTPFEGLLETVSESEIDIIKRFIEVCDRRKAKVPDWIREKVLTPV